MDVPFLFLRLACLGQIYVLGEVSFGFIFGLLNIVALCYFPHPPSQPGPVISESPWVPLSIPEQTFCQSTYNALQLLPHTAVTPQLLA